MIIKKKNNAFWGIFSYLFLQKLKGDRNDESCAINEFFCLPLRLKKMQNILSYFQQSVF